MSQSQRNSVLVVVAAVALGGAGWVYFRGGGGAELPKTQGIYGVCLSCKHEGDSTHPANERDPHECASCKARAVYPLSYCNECQKRFVPNLQRAAPGEPLRIVLPPACPVCRSANVSVFFPGLFDPAQVKGDQPLPAWEP